MNNPNYNLDSNITKNVVLKDENKISEIKFDIPNYSIDIEQINVDLSKYKNNKPTREIIRGKLINEWNKERNYN